jgi:hypothetical protein
MLSLNATEIRRFFKVDAEATPVPTIPPVAFFGRKDTEKPQQLRSEFTSRVVNERKAWYCPHILP